MGSPSLDNYKHNRNGGGCGDGCLTGPAFVGTTLAQGYARYRCKSWFCPYCGTKKAYQLRRAIQEWIQHLNLKRLMTLTLDPARIPPGEDPIKYIRSTFNKFRVSLKRKYGEPISYISILELHKSGNPHVHILVDRHIPQAWISKSWQAVGGGRIVDIRMVDLHKAPHYLTKYLSKQAILSVPRGIRRYTTSRNIKLFRNNNRIGNQYVLDFAIPKSSGWSVASRSIEFYYKHAWTDILVEDFDEDGSIRFFATKNEILN